MSRKRNPSPRHLTVRLRPDLTARIDALADSMALIGSEPSRSAAVRAALLAGLDVLEAQKTTEGPASEGRAGSHDTTGD